jgi:hypothetical protein
MSDEHCREIPGLRARPLLVTGGAAVVVWIPASYRNPHMVIYKGGTEFWIRHDRQKARMAIGEIRSAITTTEDLAMRAERCIEERRASALSGLKSGACQLFVMATPLRLFHPDNDGADAAPRVRATHEGR